MSSNNGAAGAAGIPEGISGVIPADSITQVDALKLILLGEPGAGKSWCSCTGRPPIFVADCDDRRASIAGKPGVLVKTYVDRNPLMPHAWSDIETDLGAFEYAKQKGTLGIKTYVIASLTYLLKYAQHQLIKDQPSLCRTGVINGTKYPITQGWDSVIYAQKMIEGLLNRLFELGVDVIVEAHIRREKDATWTEKNPKFTDKWSIDPQNLKMLLPVFNERWLVDNANDSYKVTTKPTYDFNAVTALNIDGSETANITEILAKHDINTKNKKGASRGH